VRSLPHAIVVDAEKLAMEAGDVQTLNTVMVGAVVRLLPLRVETIEKAVAATFASKGDAVIKANLAALRAGGQAAACTAA
jgi:indolepyruvate ferredoxin oxidoreductase beta subunit